jgi:hypothetical protein
MKKQNLCLEMLVLALTFGLTVIGCGGGGGPGVIYIPPNEQDPLTGTVTVTSSITKSLGTETMTLTADTSDLNGTFYSYQWTRDNVKISEADYAIYIVTETDYGKTLKVTVTESGHTGEKSGNFTVPTPTTLNLTLKWANEAGKKDTYIVIEEQAGTYWKSAPSSGVNLTTTGTTVTLASWTETQFKMRTAYTTIDTKYYFKKENALGSELFDLTNGAKTYTLTNIADGFGILTGLFTTAE